MIFKKINRFFYHFWTEEKGLTSILILLLINNFCIPPRVLELVWVQLTIAVMWLFLMIAGIAHLSKNKFQASLFFCVPSLLIVFTVLTNNFHNTLLTIGSFVVDVTFIGLMIVFIFKKVFEEGPVTWHRVVGAIVVYLLLGNLFSNIYFFFYMNLPGSFQIASVESVSESLRSSFLYFSYTTLTTTGFGEIVPIQPFVRNVVVVEQLIGVLYPVVLISRLVSSKS
jgi:hypothetical protein